MFSGPPVVYLAMVGDNISIKSFSAANGSTKLHQKKFPLQSSNHSSNKLWEPLLNFPRGVDWDFFWVSRDS